MLRFPTGSWLNYSTVNQTTLSPSWGARVPELRTSVVTGNTPAGQMQGSFWFDKKQAALKTCLRARLKCVLIKLRNWLTDRTDVSWMSFDDSQEPPLPHFLPSSSQICKLYQSRSRQLNAKSAHVQRAARHGPFPILKAEFRASKQSLYTSCTSNIGSTLLPQEPPACTRACSTKWSTSSVVS